MTLGGKARTRKLHSTVLFASRQNIDTQKVFYQVVHMKEDTGCPYIAWGDYPMDKHLSCKCEMHEMWSSCPQNPSKNSGRHGSCL